jgi:Protein of unknown function (DUF3105)
VQAPKRRAAEPTRRSSPFGGVPWWGWLAGVVVLAAIVGGVVVLSGGSSGTSTSGLKSTMIAAGCTYRDVKPFPPKNKTNFHADVPTESSKVKWSTSPPSAGSHYGLWAVWGFYRDPVNPRRVVHNEEHGGVVIWWGPKVPASTVDKLEAFYNEKPESMLGTPYASLGNRLALTAWTGDPSHYYQDGDYGTGHIAICPRYDEKAFRAFRDAYRGKGPEGIPASNNKPGMGPGG